MDKADWQFLNSFAPWLAAVGTIAAVVVSLYLALRSERVRLKVSAGVWTMAGGQHHGKQFYLVDVTNVGRRPATVRTMYWKPRPWSKAGLVWHPPVNEFSSPFPISLADGQTATYILPLADFEANFSDHARKWFSGVFRSPKLKLLKFCVSTSTGQVAVAKPTKDLLDLYARMARS